LTQKAPIRRTGIGGFCVGQGVAFQSPLVWTGTAWFETGLTNDPPSPGFGTFAIRIDFILNPPMNTPQETPMLSPREVEILHLVGTGKTDKCIADTLGIECRTVESHRLSIRRKNCILGGKTALFHFARLHVREFLPKIGSAESRAGGGNTLINSGLNSTFISFALEPVG